jgi:hypothetical protein
LWSVERARKKRPVVANTAIARELAGWCWSLALDTCVSAHNCTNDPCGGGSA